MAQPVQLVALHGPQALPIEATKPRSLRCATRESNRSIRFPPHRGQATRVGRRINCSNSALHALQRYS